MKLIYFLGVCLNYFLCRIEKATYRGYFCRRCQHPLWLIRSVTQSLRVSWIDPNRVASRILYHVKKIQIFNKKVVCFPAGRNMWNSTSNRRVSWPESLKCGPNAVRFYNTVNRLVSNYLKNSIYPISIIEIHILGLLLVMTDQLLKSNFDVFFILA